MTTAEPNNHAVHLGGLVANFHGLEFLLRAFMQDLPGARPLGIPTGTDIYSHPIGTRLPLSELTSYDTLRELIIKYNEEMVRRGLPIIDATLVDIRDAIAHGRVSAPRMNDACRLLKFSKPDKTGCVTVTFNETLTSAWYVLQKKRVVDAMKSIASNAPSKIVVMPVSK